MGRLHAGVCRADTPASRPSPGVAPDGRADGSTSRSWRRRWCSTTAARIAPVAPTSCGCAASRSRRRRAATLTGIPADAILLNASHNHSAPVLLEPDSVRAAVRTDGLDGYAAAPPDRLAGAVLAPARGFSPRRSAVAGRAGLWGTRSTASTSGGPSTTP